jgi:hypothetical protein
MSVGLPLVLAGHFEWTVAAGLLIVHRFSNGKVRRTERSDQKWPDKQRKVSGKLLGLQSKKNCVLNTLSPTESARKSSGSVKTSQNITKVGLRLQSLLIDYKRLQKLDLDYKVY